MTKNPFDFADLSDLPEDLQNKLHTDTTDNAKAYAEVVEAGAKAGYDELDINQIMAAAMRMDMDVPTQQTVRNYLNKAVELKLIVKPTRQTYGMPAKGSAKAAAVETDDPVAATDPLAGI